MYGERSKPTDTKSTLNISVSNSNIHRFHNTTVNTSGLARTKRRNTNVQSHIFRMHFSCLAQIRVSGFIELLKSRRFKHIFIKYKESERHGRACSAHTSPFDSARFEKLARGERAAQPGQAGENFYCVRLLVRRAKVCLWTRPTFQKNAIFTLFPSVRLYFDCVCYCLHFGDTFINVAFLLVRALLQSV